jgi:hypothetical protein
MPRHCLLSHSHGYRNVHQALRYTRSPGFIHWLFGPHLELLLYGLAGPNVGYEDYIEADANIKSNPWWRLYAGDRATTQFRFRALWKDVPSQQFVHPFQRKSCKMPEGRSPRLDLHGLQLQYQQLRQRPNQGALLRPCRPQHLYLLPFVLVPEYLIPRSSESWEHFFDT